MSSRGIGILIHLQRDQVLVVVLSLLTLVHLVEGTLKIFTVLVLELIQVDLRDDGFGFGGLLLLATLDLRGQLIIIKMTGPHFNFLKHRLVEAVVLLTLLLLLSIRLWFNLFLSDLEC